MTQVWREWVLNNAAQRGGKTRGRGGCGSQGSRGHESRSCSITEQNRQNRGWGRGSRCWVTWELDPMNKARYAS